MLFRLNTGLDMISLGTTLLYEIGSSRNWKYGLRSKVGTGEQNVFSEYCTYGSHCG